MSVESANRLEKNPALDKENIASLSARGISPEGAIGDGVPGSLDVPPVSGAALGCNCPGPIKQDACSRSPQPSDISLLARDRTIPVGRRPLVMGIVNINDDSFSGDGRIDSRWALDRALEMVAEGADIVDVGGESARTNRPPVNEDEEWSRIADFVKEFPSRMKTARPRDEGQVFPPLLSVNTWRTGVVTRALNAGCDLLNDMGGLPDATHARLCAEHGTALLIMHTKGEPKIPQTHVQYRDVMADLEDFFDGKVALATAAGLPRNSLVLDPGIDFAKQTGDNLRIYRELPRLARFGCPILLPVSRKSTIGDVLGIPDPAERDAGTIACIVAGALRGACIFRVHNINAAWLALRATSLVN